MLVVKVELHSAITGQITELYRMIIANDATGSKDVGNYEIRTGKKGCQDNRKVYHKPSRHGVVRGHRRLTEHVWKLVAKALDSAGFGVTSRVASAVDHSTPPLDTTSPTK